MHKLPIAFHERRGIVGGREISAQRTEPPKFRETFLTRYRWSIFAALVVVIFAMFCGVAIYPRQAGWEQRYPWLGNTYELANALFAALAFAGVVFTILLQSEELRLQRQELEETQAELRRSADAQQKSEQTLLLTAFLSAQNSLFLANEQQREAESKDWFKPSDIQRSRILALLKTLTDTLHQKVPADLALSPSQAMRHCLRRYVADFEGFLRLLESADDFDAMRNTLLEQTFKMRRFVDMLPPDHDERRRLRALIDEVTTIVGDPPMSRDPLGVNVYDEGNRAELKQIANRAIAALKKFAAD